ncbi:MULTISPECIES: Spy/CpxP family protein refolding chaperone [unclassified Rhizobium]|uniref:Spy/CpxP family protein refolding chaperone n=1 Tax=unclassified Rhizobium TaxID=2613769 RepID=UPI00160392D2|nr:MULTISPECIES: periplasmic heavy metal sensor [unclassified Rhizobium]MBB1247848.1 periplasmic heavy metal sensor [Rhizobium sp. G21]MCV3768630.1 periplasmic heavy metal sensor [Rhizobium sp. TRM95796]
MTQDLETGIVEAPKSNWLRRIVIIGSTTAVVLGAGALAFADGKDGFGPGGMRQRLMHGYMEYRMDRMLDDAGADDAQKAKIKTILKTAMDQVRPDRQERRAMRDGALDLLEAPTIDRAAIESFRAQQIEKLDAKSKIIAKAVADAADVLNPDQRKKLVDELDEMGFGRGRGMDGDHPPGMMDDMTPKAP